MQFATYVPSQSDIVWARNLIRAVKDGATWTIPRSGVVFKFNKAKMQLVQIAGPTSGEEWEHEIHVNRAVFAALDWQVIPSSTESMVTVENPHWGKVTGNKR